MAAVDDILDTAYAARKKQILSEAPLTLLSNELYRLFGEFKCNDISTPVIAIICSFLHFTADTYGGLFLLLNTIKMEADVLRGNTPVHLQSEILAVYDSLTKRLDNFLQFCAFARLGKDAFELLRAVSTEVDGVFENDRTPTTVARNQVVHVAIGTIVYRRHLGVRTISGFDKQLLVRLTGMPIHGHDGMCVGVSAHSLGVSRSGATIRTLECGLAVRPRGSSMIPPDRVWMKMIVAGYTVQEAALLCFVVCDHVAISAKCWSWRSRVLEYGQEMQRESARGDPSKKTTPHTNKP